MALKNKIILALAAILLVVICLAVYNNLFSPKARIKTTVEQTTKAFLTKNKAVIMGNISSDFDSYPFTKPKVDTSLTVFFREFEKTKIVLDDQKIHVLKNEAVDTIGVIVLVSRGGEQGYILGSFGNPALVTIKLKKRKKWQITGVEGLKIF